MDACRIATDEDTGRAQGSDIRGGNWVSSTRKSTYVSVGSPAGRWPANVLLDHHAAAWIDEQSGDIAPSKRKAKRDYANNRTVYSPIDGIAEGNEWGYEGAGGASRFFYTAKAPKRERPTYTRPVLRLRDNLTPAQVDHVRARLQEAGISLD